MSVTVVSCLYGTTHGRFVSEWDHAIAQLDPRPDEVLVLCDRYYSFVNAQAFVVAGSTWQHPQAFYQQLAFEMALTEWVWVVDIDDRAMPDALCGLYGVAADVWQVGFHRSDGETYVPPRLTNDEYLDLDSNPYVGTSMIRKQAFDAVGGFDDIAFQDWGLWRKLARAGASFEPSDRAHFHYTMHPDRRGETELTLDVRSAHVAEMMEAERCAA